MNLARIASTSPWGQTSMSIQRMRKIIWETHSFDRAWRISQKVILCVPTLSIKNRLDNWRHEGHRYQAYWISNGLWVPCKMCLLFWFSECSIKGYSFAWRLLGLSKGASVHCAKAEIEQQVLALPVSSWNQIADIVTTTRIPISRQLKVYIANVTLTN